MTLQQPSRTRSDLPATAELRHDLHKTQYLLRILAGLPLAGDDSDDVVWLRNRQRFLQSVIASRRQLQQQKVVSLAQWRCGAAPPVRPLACVA